MQVPPGAQQGWLSPPQAQTPPAQVSPPLQRIAPTQPPPQQDCPRWPQVVMHLKSREQTRPPVQLWASLQQTWFRVPQLQMPLALQPSPG